MRFRPSILEPKPLHALIEDARLATLERYRTLSDEQIAGLSRLAQEAALGLEATHCSVGFVDSSRVWFGGAFGFDRGDVTRDGSFCDTVVRTGVPLLVPNGAEDPRFRAHELICDRPEVRSYAGVPLLDAGGYTLGTVAVYSVIPGRFRAGIFVELGGLAALVRDFLDAAPVSAVPSAAPVRTVRAWLGVKTAPSKLGGGGRGEGLIISSVAKGSPAAEAGLRPADLLHAIDGQVMMSAEDITEAMSGRVAGSRARLSVRRGGAWLECAVEIRAKTRIRVR